MAPSHVRTYPSKLSQIPFFFLWDSCTRVCVAHFNPALCHISSPCVCQLTNKYQVLILRSNEQTTFFLSYLLVFSSVSWNIFFFLPFRFLCFFLSVLLLSFFCNFNVLREAGEYNARISAWCYPSGYDALRLHGLNFSTDMKWKNSNESRNVDISWVGKKMDIYF